MAVPARIEPARSARRVSAAGASARRTTTLRVVPKQRRTVRMVAVMSVMIVVSMLGAAAFQTYLAKGQLEIDRLDHQIAKTTQQYGVLRSQRAELLSPGRLTSAATNAHMVPATKVAFMTISPDITQIVSASTGELSPTYAAESTFLEQYRAVKSLQRTTP